MKRTLIPLIALTLLFTACQSATPTPLPPTPSAIPDTIVEGAELTIFVEPAIRHQTIKDVTGGNFINVFTGNTDPLEPVSIYNLEHLDVRVARVRMTLEEWEPVNDDADPGNFNWDAFQDTDFNHATFQLMQELQARGTEIIVTSWDVPDWLVANPNKSTVRFIPYELYPEAVEIVASWLVTARDQYGVEPAYVSFNEPDVGAYVSIAPFEAVMLIEQAGKRFDELGLTTKWLIADTSNIDGSVAYARSVLRSEVVKPYLGIFANHSWDSDSPDSDYLEVREYALENDLEVWCTETGSHAFSWQHPEKFLTYKYAVELARIYSRVLKLTGTTAILYWEMMGTDYWINDGTNPYPSFHVIRQFGEQIPTGSVIVETSTNTEEFYSVAAQAPDHFVVVMVNTGADNLDVNLEGLPPGAYQHLQTTEAALEKSIGLYEISGEAVAFQIPALSISILTTRTP
jgi:hypothetical protein